DDDGKQDVFMDEIDEQNKEDLCKEDNGDQTVKHNDTNEDTGNTDLAFVDIRDKQNNDDSELSKNADAKSEKENEEFDALAITICNVCHRVPLRVVMPNEGEFYTSPYELKPIEPKIRVSASEKLVADTSFAMMYKPREIVFETYEGFKVLAIEMETLATGLDVHYEVINAWCDVLYTIEKDRKDDDKTMRKYCFKIGFLHSVFVDFLQSIEHRSYKKLRHAKLEVVKLDFKKRNDHADCGIIVMTAMDCYMGKVKKMKDMFL
nr:hypothetical protein [Tanacetum cinerariifolium]